MFKLKLIVHIENLTDRSTPLFFGGEWFETGGWLGDRKTWLEDYDQLEFENVSIFNGVSGYVHFHTSDHAMNLAIAFSHPLLSATRFTARVCPTLLDCDALFRRTPELAPPGSGLRCAHGCAWETLEIEHSCIQIRCVILPLASPASLPEGSFCGQLYNDKISDELRSRLSKAQLCKSTVADDKSIAPANQDVEHGLFFKREFIIEIDNRSHETFIHDGDWFEAGGWSCENPVSKLPPQAATSLHFVNTGLLHGIFGVVWFVNETGLDTYFSFVFANPIAGEGCFQAWAGPPPQDLRAELYSAPGLSSMIGVQVPRGHGCAWNIIEQSSVVHVRLAILGDIAPIDPLAYPPRPCPSTKVDNSENCDKGNVAVDEASADRSSNNVYITDQATVTNEDEDLQAASSTARKSLSVLPLRSEADEEQSAVEKLLSSTRPRDALDGMGSGLKVAGAGVLLGTTALVVAPTVGAKQGGVNGFFAGLAKGAGAAVGFTLGGAVAGVAQVARGVANTPEALQQAHAGKRWDPDVNAWVDDETNLREEVGDIEGESSNEELDAEVSEQGENGRPSKKVADMRYYNIIGVAPNARFEEIKKAYYKAALQVHPDKNPDDPQASARFQELAQAYQVLSDPSLREKYDQMGIEAVKENAMPSIDAALFFGMLFGSEQFEKYIGKLYLAIQTDRLAKDLQRDMARQRKGDSQKSAEQIMANTGWEVPGFGDSKKERRLRRQQFIREVSCAKRLCERLDRWVAGRDEVGFMNAVAQEANELIQVSFGGRLLRTIGAVYVTCAEQFFMDLRGHLTVEQHLNHLCESSSSAKAKLNATYSVTKSALAVKRMHDSMSASMVEQEEGKKEEATRQSIGAFEESLPLFLQTVWEISAIDIETTLRHVCDKILKDISVPWQFRHRRAVALLRLGRVFRDVGQLEQADLSQSSVAKKHLEEALFSAIKEKS